MADYFLIRQGRGPDWDESQPRRDQPGWDEHAGFMDALVEAGVVVLGGPVGDVNGQDTVLVVDADTEAAARAHLADDPWRDSILTIKSVEPWTVWLRPRRLGNAG